jgi:uncharacterized repeat protein (TIGR03803 family)
MTKLNSWKKVSVMFVLCATTAIAAPAQVFNTLVDFNTSDGYGPYLVSLIQGRDGQLYGTTESGGANGDGTAFKVTLGGNLTDLHDFSGQPNDGQQPDSGLVQGTDGSFYGTTTNGGTDDYGTVFKVTSEGRQTTLYSFLCTGNCHDGAEPIAPLVLGADGNLYGTTNQGGGNRAAGTVFRITADGALTTLYSFCAKANCTDGSNPFAGLLQTVDGDFYGTTYGGGTNNSGTVFKVSRSGTLVTLHSFDGDDGAAPAGALVQANDGNFYGTTTQGGTYGHGALFRLTPSGGFRLLHSFCAQANCADGDRPQSGLIQATDGSLYGTTFQGGTNVFGTVFKLDSNGLFTILHDFAFHTDGGQLCGGLLQATNGTLYGTTFAGGSGDSGTVFSLDMGLGPFIALVHSSGKVGQTGGILGQGFTGTTSVSLNGTPADFTVVSDTFIKATVPPGATTGYVTVVTPSGTLTSNVPFRVLP